MITSKNIDLAQSLYRLENMLEAEEGCRLVRYLDTKGIPTIGWGHEIRPGENFYNGITQDQADAMLLADLEVAYDDALELVTELNDFCDARQAVIVDMSYNMGIDRFGAFHEMFAALADVDFMRAAYEMRNSLWYGEHPARSQVLYMMMITGEWQ